MAKPTIDDVRRAMASTPGFEERVLELVADVLGMREDVVDDVGLYAGGTDDLMHELRDAYYGTGPKP